MAQALRLYGALLGAGLRGEMQYRVNFVIWVITGLVYQLTGWVFIWVLLTRFEALAGWTLGDVAFLYGIRLLGHAVGLVAFGRIDLLERFVREAEFDRFLVRPTPVLLQVMTRTFPTAALGDLLGGIALFVAASRLVAVAWSPIAVVYLLLAVIGAALLETGVKLALASLSFRFLATRRAIFVADEVFSNFGNYPMRIFGGVVQFLLTFALPVAFVAYLPASVLLERTHELHVQPLVAYLAPLAGAVVFAIAVLIWRGEMKQYQSAGH